MQLSAGQHSALAVAFSQAASDPALSVGQQQSFGRKALWFQQLAKLAKKQSTKGQSDKAQPQAQQQSEPAFEPQAPQTPNLPLPSES